MDERIKSLVADNLKQKLSKDQVARILGEEDIPTETYNNFILGMLSSSRRPPQMGSPRTLRTDAFLDSNYLKSIVRPRRREGERYGGRKTLFEKRGIPTRCYGTTRSSSYRLTNKMLTTEELSAKFRDYAEELGMNRNVSMECVDYLRRALELYIKNLVSDCKGKVTVPNLKRSLGKHLHLFNNLSML